MGNTPHIIETALLLLIAFLIGCLIGWVFRAKIFADRRIAAPADNPTAEANAQRTSAAKSPETQDLPDAASNTDRDDDAVSDIGRPQGLSGPRGEAKDDLKKITGIGPKIENTLNGLGIYHFDQIADWDRAAIDWIDDYLSFRGRIDRDGWVQQASDYAKQ